MKDGLSISGNVYMTITDSNGNKKKYHYKNRVVQSGLAIIISRLIDGTGSTVTHMALGSGTTPPDGLDSGMESLVVTAALDNALTTMTPPVGGAIEFRSTLPITSAGTLSECGMFCDGTLFARSVFPPVDVMADMVIDINWVISLTSV